jgi:hypothetical protein
MDAAESLRSIGFDVEVEQEAPDLYWCHLVPLDSIDRPGGAQIRPRFDGASGD